MPSRARRCCCCPDAAPGGARAGRRRPVTIDYWLWDTAQQPQYQACADAFHKANPQYTVKITQYGWDDYWNTLTTAFVSGTAPDVFVGHLSRYPELAAQARSSPWTNTSPRTRWTCRSTRTACRPVGRQGRQTVRAAKDFDTVAVIYNTDLLKKAGIKPEEMAELSWNRRTAARTRRSSPAHVDKNGSAATSGLTRRTSPPTPRLNAARRLGDDAVRSRAVRDSVATRHCDP
ncbi:N-Acetyl-D-glucosamine ABC transport system, sugar-binding protein [[Actinomadura] parvosata subsp. kistnae]|uniref:ABC transporter substrate-binding protein n=1 Tax=[Actinomadura] parvosata TaxID=1955412 RepID=UPI000D2C3389|nr:N-Acetyl-D-glucosamine ABC transport system, sugar-binding protein [Actinomadura parvosata subsp. kistnae]